MQRRLVCRAARFGRLFVGGSRSKVQMMREKGVNEGDELEQKAINRVAGAVVA